MHVSLLLVGANNGEKQRELILQAAQRGAVILIEPVPYLFTALSATYAGVPNVVCLRLCVTSEPGSVTFYAPTQEATGVFPWGDQLGSMNADHAVRHQEALAPHIVELLVNAVTFPDLVRQFDITSLEVLFTDTEGYDAELLSLFPYDRVLPYQIIFEYKHADGTFNIGAKLGRLLIKLDEAGYDMRIIDAENCLATRRAA